MKKGIRILLISIPVIFIVTVVFPHIIFTLLNNAALHRFSEQLYNCPLPDDTIMIEKHGLCEKLNGNGNGMDFIAAMLVESDLTIDALNRYYGKVNFYTAKNATF